jgi:hypothetical protein
MLVSLLKASLDHHKKALLSVKLLAHYRKYRRKGLKFRYYLDMVSFGRENHHFEPIVKMILIQGQLPQGNLCYHAPGLLWAKHMDRA